MWNADILTNFNLGNLNQNIIGINFKEADSYFYPRYIDEISIELLSKYSKNISRKTDTPACVRLVTLYKSLPFIWVLSRVRKYAKMGKICSFFYLRQSFFAILKISNRK